MSPADLPHSHELSTSGSFTCQRLHLISPQLACPKSARDDQQAAVALQSDVLYTQVAPAAWIGFSGLARHCSAPALKCRGSASRSSRSKQPDEPWPETNAGLELIQSHEKPVILQQVILKASPFLGDNQIYAWQIAC